MQSLPLLVFHEGRPSGLTQKLQMCTISGYNSFHRDFIPWTLLLINFCILIVKQDSQQVSCSKFLNWLTLNRSLVSGKVFIAECLNMDSNYMKTIPKTATSITLHSNAMEWHQCQFAIGLSTREVHISHSQEIFLILELLNTGG